MPLSHVLVGRPLEQARKHLREALRLDPDHPEGSRTLKRVRKLEGHMTAAKQAFTQRDFERARDEFTEALVRHERRLQPTTRSPLRVL